MNPTERYKQAIRKLQEELDTTDGAEKNSKFWNERGAQLLILIDQIVTDAHCANALIPNNSSCDGQTPESGSILSLVFSILGEISNVNSPFVQPTWLAHWNTAGDKLSFHQLVSFYELAAVQMISLISVLLGDKLAYVQRVLIKFLFRTDSTVCSLFASDLLTYVIRMLPPRQSSSLCLVIMNLCKVAPKESLVNGAALLKRVKHPSINFENPNYQFILQLH